MPASSAARISRRFSLLGLFGSRLPIDADELDLQLATFKWPIGESPLVLPTPEFFPFAAATGKAGAAPFEDARQVAGPGEWPCQLQAGDASAEAGDDDSDDGYSSATCGLFGVRETADGSVGIYAFDPELERDQVGLVATFAHGLAHHLFATSSHSGPGGWDLLELHADLGAVYLGFGIFLANNARTLVRYSGDHRSGWESRLPGHVSKGGLVTALVIFQRLAGRDPLAAAPHLEDDLRTDLRRAAGVLAKLHPDVAAGPWRRPACPVITASEEASAPFRRQGRAVGDVGRAGHGG